MEIFIEKYVDDGGKEATVKSYFKRLEDLGINPVTISRRDIGGIPLPNGGRVLPSIFTMIDRMRDIEKDNKEHPEKVFELMGFRSFETISVKNSHYVKRSLQKISSRLTIWYIYHII